MPYCSTMVDKFPSLRIKAKRPNGQEFELEIGASLLRWVFVLVVTIVAVVRGVPMHRIIPLPFCSHVNLRKANRRLQAFGMSNLRYTYCFRTRQNQDAARPTRFPDHGASRKGQSRAACSLVSLPTFRRYQGTAEDHGQDCGAIQKVRRHDSGPGEKDRFLSLIFATVLLPLLRIFWISGLQQTLCL